MQASEPVRPQEDQGKRPELPPEHTWGEGAHSPDPRLDHEKITQFVAENFEYFEAFVRHIKGKQKMEEEEPPVPPLHRKIVEEVPDSSEDESDDSYSKRRKSKEAFIPQHLKYATKKHERAMRNQDIQ